MASFQAIHDSSAHFTRAGNFATPANFTNLITQMAGTCLLAYGVVFVLLIGEIDLSIAFVSGIAGVVVARLQEAEPAGPDMVWYVCIAAAILPLG